MTSSSDKSDQSDKTDSDSEDKATYNFSRVGVVIMDNVVIGNNAVIEDDVVREDTTIMSDQVWSGNPATFSRTLNPLERDNHEENIKE